MNTPSHGYLNYPFAASASASPHAPASLVHSRDVLQNALSDPMELRELPEELQDVVLAREVLSAAVGLGGQFIQRIGESSASSGGGRGAATGFIVSDAVPASLRGMCQAILPVADAWVALRHVEDAEYLGKSLVAMALGEVVSEVCTAYALEVSKLQLWSRDDPQGRSMPLMRVITDLTRVGHHLVRLRQQLPLELVNFAGAAGDPVLCVGAAPSNPGPSADGTATTAAGSSGTSGSSYHYAKPSSSAVLEAANQQAFLSGSRLLNYLNDQLQKCGGSKEESDLLNLLLRRALIPYLRLLRRWMHEGILEDPFGEFFITENNTGSRYTAASAGQRSSRHVTQVFPELTTSTLGVPEPSSFTYKHQYFTTATAASSSAGVGGPSLSAQQEATAFERRFSMNKLLMPFFLEKPSRVAKMVFFTGKYCCLLRECHEALPDFSTTTTMPSAADTDTEPQLLWEGVEDMHRKIQRSFELASQTVIQLLFSPGVDLMGHLSSIKIFYLHSQGDWITDFLDSADDLLTKSRDRVKGHSLRVLLQAAIARCCTANDPYHHLISCSFSDVTLEQHTLRWRKETGEEAKRRVGGEGEGGGGPDALLHHPAGGGRLSAGTKVEAHRCIELLQLEADLKWPLTLVLDPGVMARFNTIFRLLTWVKVCERSLGSLWNTNEVLASFPIAYGIKHQFTQFLRQFQFFAAHYVLEPQWRRLVSRLTGPAESLFAINQALNDFFTEVERGLTLSSTPRFASLRAVLTLVSRFCDVGRHSSSTTLPLMEATLNSVLDQYLIALSELASAVGPDYPQLVPLLTCIDFNGFYDQNNVYHVQQSSSSIAL